MSTDLVLIEEVVRSASDAYSQAGISDPRLELAMAEVHERQIESVAAGHKLGLTQNLGGGPGECVPFVSVVGTELAA